MSETIMTGPVQVGLPPMEPEPVDGCDACEALARERETARRDGDLSKVTDANVTMRAHQQRGCA